MSDGHAPLELTNDEHQEVARELERRKRLLVRNGVLTLLLLASLLLFGLPWWIVAALLALHAATWSFLARHYQRTVQAAVAAGWRGFDGP